MNFTSIQFAFYFFSVFVLYWFVFSRTYQRQNFFLLVASYLFYAWWDWRFLGLILISSLAPYIAARMLEKPLNSSMRKIILFSTLFINLGLLAFFKYYGFFVGSFIKAFASIGIYLHLTPLNIILPVGISFYTFTAIGYLLDVYNKKIKAASEPSAFFIFVSFFPQLMAGPIGRATTLLPQFCCQREFKYDKAVDGARQILWGLFKKIVIADSCAVYADRIFTNYESLPGSTLLIGMLYYGMQIYADFSGYSDMAVGMGKMLGIDLMRNFAYPYFSVNISDFWRRWHISLSFWFRDYLFLPIAYYVNREIKSASLLLIKAETWAYAIGIVCTWFLVGLWHGASWNYVTWGLLHGFMLVSFHLLKLMKKRYKIVNFTRNSKVFKYISLCFTYILVQITWVFFRSETPSAAVSFLTSIPRTSFFNRPYHIGSYLYFLLLAFVVLEWLQRNNEHGLRLDSIRWPAVRWGICYFVLFFILFYLSREQTFIYLQF